MNANTPNPSSQPMPSDRFMVAQSDQLSLFDLFEIIMQHKSIVISCMFLGVAAGLCAAFALPKIYAISTVIEIGSTEQNGVGQTPIEPPDAVIAKLKNVYLPQIEVIHGQTIGEVNFVFPINITNPKNTRLITLTSNTALEKEAENIALQKQLSTKLTEEHHNKLSIIRSSLEAELESAQRALASIKDQGKELEVQKKLLEQNRELTGKHLQDVEVQTKHIQENRAIAGQSVDNKEQVLTIMMLDLQIARERDRRDELQKRLSIDFVADAERLLREESAHARAVQAQESAIAQIINRIEHLSESKIINPPQRSQRPVGLGGLMKALIGLVVGLMAGALLVFLIYNIKQRQVSKPTPIH